MPERALSRENDSCVNSSLKNSCYRPEIDGLRAFAVVAVIVNHFNKDILPGGYLGVDIFFVISGYVITSSLYGRSSKDFKDFICGFYARRIKRLVPALSVFALIMSISICLFNPDPELSLQTGMSSVFGVSNLYLLKQSTDYFAPSAEFNVFTHTWSLGVEEQFYISFPFLIWFSGFGKKTKKGPRNLFLIVGSLTIASLIGFLCLYPTNQPAAYFLIRTRFWEMAVGCLTFVGFQNRAFLEILPEKVPPFLLIALIVGVMYLPMSMAAASTVVVVALSSILIASLKKQTAAFKIFTKPKVVYIGLISYSLYLWHWGVLSISRWTIGIHWWSVPFQVALMLGLAVASYRWIETPLRRGNWFGKRWKTLVVGGGALVTVSGGLVALGGPLKGKLFAGIAAPREEIPLTTSGASIRGKCNTYEKSASEIFKDCMFRKRSSSNTIWLTGDSHAESLLIAADALASERKTNLFAHFFGATAFPSTPYKRIDNDTMLAASKVFKQIEEAMLEKFMVGDIVIIGLRYPYHFGKDWYEYKTDQFLFPDENGKFIKNKDKREYFDRWKRSLNKFAKAASKKEVSIVLITPTPEFPLARWNNCKSQNSQWFNQLSKSTCSHRKEFFDGGNGIYSHINHALAELAFINKNILLVDGIDAMCGKEVCLYTDNGNPLYRDDDHISNHGARSRLLPALRSLFNQRIRP